MDWQGGSGTREELSDVDRPWMESYIHSLPHPTTTSPSPLFLPSRPPSSPMSSLVAQPTAEEYDNDSRAGDADDEESREVSPTPSEALSVYSYVSSQNGHLILRDVFGRTINSTNDYYMLPGMPL